MNINGIMLTFFPNEIEYAGMKTMVYEGEGSVRADVEYTNA